MYPPQQLCEHTLCLDCWDENEGVCPCHDFDLGSMDELAGVKAKAEGSASREASPKGEGSGDREVRQKTKAKPKATGFAGALLMAMTLSAMSQPAVSVSLKGGRACPGVEAEPKVLQWRLWAIKKPIEQEPRPTAPLQGPRQLKEELACHNAEENRLNGTFAREAAYQ